LQQLLLLLVEEVLFIRAEAFYMDLFCFSEFSTVLALGDGTAFFFDFEEGTLGVLARAGAMSFDARSAGGR
jgi:hypothetical protein